MGYQKAENKGNHWKKRDFNSNNIFPAQLIFSFFMCVLIRVGSTAGEGVLGMSSLVWPVVFPAHAHSSC